MQSTGTTPAELHKRARDVFDESNKEENVEPEAKSVYYERADHEIAATGQAPRLSERRRVTNWVAALYRYEGFWRENGHTPRENTRNRSTLPGVERRLGEWARHQRRFDDMLCTYQRIRLDVSPAFDWDPQETRWQANLMASAAHLEQAGELPRLNATDPAEFALARWLGRQLRQLKARTLSRHRTNQLTELLRSSAPVPETPSQ